MKPTQTFDYPTIGKDQNGDSRVPIFGLSDPLLAPTGFARVARELFSQIPQDRYRLGYLSRGWVGTSRFPGISCYSDGNRAGMCQEAFPAAAVDFAGAGKPFVLWTLLDPWQVGWLSLPEVSPQRRPASTQFLKAYRDRICWIGHFPIDGYGPRDGPARWTERFLNGMDIPVAMSEWGRKICQPLMENGKEIRFISHAVHTDRFFPGDRDAARAKMQASYADTIARGLHALGDDAPKNPDEFMREVGDRTFQMDDHFTILCVMANRSRKYWWDVLRAFRLLLDQVPDARFIGLCGDRTGDQDDSWPLEDCCRDLGFRLDDEDLLPNVWLIETVNDPAGYPQDYSLRVLYQAADVSTLLGGGEGFGLPQLEAHACGIPCIVGDYSASTELAVNSRELISPRGYTYTTTNMLKRPVYSPKDLSDRWAWIAKNPSWRKEVGAAGVAQAQERSWPNILPQWTSLFDEAATRLGLRQEESHVVSEAVST